MSQQDAPQSPSPPPATSAAPPAEPLPSSAAADLSSTAGTTTGGSKWRLPDGIEEHIESGFVKTVVGAAVGGLVGLALFRSGGGYRSASAAAGAGIGLGSAYERAIAGRQQGGGARGGPASSSSSTY